MLADLREIVKQNPCLLMNKGKLQTRPRLILICIDKFLQLYFLNCLTVTGDRRL